MFIFFFLSTCSVSFYFAMIALNDWREQLKVQVRIHPSWTGVEWCLDAFSSSFHL